MKLQIYSDLHREGNDRFIIPDIESDIIILAGDIDYGTKGVAWAIEESHRLQKNIIYVMGNHEYYKRDYDQVNESAKELAWNTGVVLLNNDSFKQVDDTDGKIVRFLGTTLWSNFRGLGDQYLIKAKSDATRWIADYRVIRYKTRLLVPDDTEEFYHKATSWLYSELVQPFDGKTVLITHHGPSPQCHNLQLHGIPNPLSTYFWSDLEDLFNTQYINLGIYGHTHSNLKFTVNGVPIVCNQKGYGGENKDSFDPNYIIEV